MNRVLIVVAALVVIGLVAFAALAWRPSIAEADVPDAASFPADQVERGRQLAAAGYCATCHTKAGGPEYAGGRGIESDFGVIYATNITPDPEQGIGRWSEEAFARALRKGVRRDGAHLFPALPYTHFAMMSDEDVSALYAFMMTVPAAATEIPDNTLGAPYNWRALQGGWKLLFVRGGAFRPDPDKSEEWNRGSYLAEGVGHCGACHTPRNALGAERGGAARYAGAVVEGEYAPAINATPDAALPWTADELYAYLRNGASPLHGSATGTMSEVIHDGLAALPDSDIRALAVYFADMAGAPAQVAVADVAAASAGAEAELSESAARGELIYIGYCVSCHFNRPDEPSAERPELAVNSAILGADPSTFVRAVVHGVSDPMGNPDTYMPGFGLILSNQDVADVAAYLRATYAGGRAWDGLEAQIADARTSGPS